RLGDRVTRLAAAHLEALDRDLLMFVNLHPHDLADAEILERRLQPLLPHSRRVVLEITERGRVVDAEPATAMLKRHGFSIAVDDLGSGYNSLSTLAQLAPSFIKIDMSLIRGIDRDPPKQRLLELVSQFGVTA